MIRNIPKRWRELSGQNSWKSLLDPLDLDLRRYIIHYGELAETAYDTFNSQRASEYEGDSRYKEKDLFSEVGLHVANPFRYRGIEVPVRDFGDQSPGGVHGEAGVGGGLGQGVQLDGVRGSGDRQREGRAREEGRRGLVERDGPGLRMGERLRFPVGARLRDSRSRGRSHGSRRVALHLHLLRSSVALQQEECQAAGMNIIRVKMVGSVFFFFFFFQINRRIPIKII